ncbi:MAG: ATP synthase F0 subunit A, partial [Flavobacteriaceae bacterium]
MKRKSTILINAKKSVAFLAIFFTSFTFANNKEAAEGGDLKSEIKEYIAHHLLDSYDFSLFSYTNEAGEHVYIGAPLPIILWDNGLKVFSSSKFHHGETVAAIDGNYYALYHNKIYKTDAEGTINLDETNHPTNVKPLDLSITKSVVSMILVFALMFFLFKSLADSYAKNGG